MSSYLFDSVLRADLSQSAAQRGITLGLLVQVFAEVRGEVVFAGPSTLSDASTSRKLSLRRSLCGHGLPYSEKFDQVVFGAPRTQEQYKTLAFYTSDNVTETKAHFYTSGFDARDSHAMRTMSLSISSTQTCSVGSQSSVGVDVINKAKDVV